MALIGVSGTVLRGALKLADDIRDTLEKASRGEVKMSIGQKMGALSQVGLLAQRIASAAGDVVKMERLLLGEPTEIIGNRTIGDVDFDEAIRELEKGAEIAARIKERQERKEAFKRRVLNGRQANGNPS